MTRRDLPLIEPWFREAFAAVNGIPMKEGSAVETLRRGVSTSSGQLAIVQTGGSEPIGLLEYRLAHPAGGWATVGFLAVRADRRGWGHGSEAVRMFEEMAREAGVERLRADVAAGNGLGLYFWLRLGYRPASPDEIFWPRDAGRDIISMIRAI